MRKGKVENREMKSTLRRIEVLRSVGVILEIVGQQFIIYGRDKKKKCKCVNGIMTALRTKQ